MCVVSYQITYGNQNIIKNRKKELWSLFSFSRIKNIDDESKEILLNFLSFEFLDLNGSISKERIEISEVNQIIEIYEID